MAEERKTYELVSARGRDKPVFTGRSPRQAALKAASRGHKDIRLRERGAWRSEKTARGKTQRLGRVHVFKGQVKKVPKPENAPEWLPAKVNQPNVKKVKVEWVKS